MGIYLNFNITWVSEFYLFEFLFKYFNLDLNIGTHLNLSTYLKYLNLKPIIFNKNLN